MLTQIIETRRWPSKAAQSANEAWQHVVERAPDLAAALEARGLVDDARAVVGVSRFVQGVFLRQPAALLAAMREGLAR